MPETKKYYHNLDVDNNKVVNPLLNPLTTAQRLAVGATLTAADEGYVCFDTTSNQQYFWDGAAWITTGGGGTWGSITGLITNQTDLITYLSSNYYPLLSNPANYIDLTDLSAGTGISYNSLTGVITNSAPDQTVVLNNGTGINITGTYPNFTINATGGGGGGTITGTGTATQVAFWNSASSISSDSKLYWDNTNKYLGVNVTSPGYNLDVFGSANIILDNPGTGFFPANKFAVRNGMLRIGYDTDPILGVRYIQFTDSADTFEYFSFNADQAGNPAFSMANTSSFSINSGPANFGLGTKLVTVLNSGEVGIGTTTPTYNLDIIGTFHTTGQNTLDDLSGTGTRMVVADAAGLLSTQTIPVVPTNTVTGTGNATRVAFWDSSSSISSDSALYWDNSNKRLGIGTSTPGYSFETTGKGYFGDNVGIQTTPDNTYRLKLGNGGSMLISSGGSPYIDFNTVGTGNNTWRTENQFDTGAFNILETGASTIAFKAIKTSGNVIIGGNSSSTTSYKLDVLGNQSITGYLNFKPTGAPTQIKIGSADNIVGGTSTSANLVLIGQYAGQALSHATSNDSLIGIGYNAGGSMTSGGTYSIHIGRNSGIGITTGIFNTHIGTTNSTTLPAATSNTIHILGGGGYDLDNAGLTLGSLTSRYALIGGGYNGAYYINDFYFGAGPFVSDPANANLSFYAPSARGTDLVGPNFTINAGRGTGTGTPGDILFTTSTATSTGTTVQTLSSRMVIKGETGVVGIGTTTPNSTYKLHVVGSIATTTGINVDPTVSTKTGVYGGPNTITFWAGNNQLSTYTLVGNSPGSHFTHNLPFNNNIGTGVQNAWRIASDVVATGVNSINHVQLRIDPLYAHGVLGLGTVRGIYYDPAVASLNGADHIAWENTSGDIIHGNLATGGADEMVTVDSVGKLKRQTIPGGGGGTTRSINPVSGNTSAGAAANTDYYYFVSALATITLPTAVGNTNEYTIKRTGSGVVTIDTTSSQTIDGSLTIALNVVNQSVTLISDGSNWQII